jgi:spore germination protein KC
METRPHKYFQYMVEHGIKNGFIPDSSLYRFFKTLERGTDLFLAMYTTAEKTKSPVIKSEDEYIAGQVNTSGEVDNTQFIGSAVFRDGVMVGKINGQETRNVNILDDTTSIKDILMDIPDPFLDNHKQFAARVLKTENNKVKMNVKGARLKIDITLPLKVEILSNPSMVDYGDKKNQQIIKQKIVTHFKKMNEDLFKKTQTKLKGAPFPLPLYARRYFGTIQEFKKFNWRKSYLDAEILVHPSIEIIDYGKQEKQLKKVVK